MKMIDEKEYEELKAAAKWYGTLKSDRANLINRLDMEIAACANASEEQKDRGSLDVRQRALCEVLVWLGVREQVQA